MKIFFSPYHFGLDRTISRASILQAIERLRNYRDYLTMVYRDAKYIPSELHDISKLIE